MCVVADQGLAWQEASLDFTGNPSVTILFRGVKGGNDQQPFGDIAIDEVEVRNVPTILPCCSLEQAVT